MTNRILLPTVILAVFSSCATYRSGYTPDDVYYSPDRERVQYTVYEEESREDMRLRQQIRDARLRNMDDDLYINRPSFNSNWNRFDIISANPFFIPGQPFAMIPGTTIIVTNPISVQPGKTVPQYSPSISSLSQNQNGTSGGNGKFNLPVNRGNGSRFFGGAYNSSRQPNNSVPFNFNSGSGGAGSRFFNSGSSSGSNSSGSSSGRSVRGRKN